MEFPYLFLTFGNNCNPYGRGLYCKQLSVLVAHAIIDSGIFVIDITKPWTTTSVTATNIVTEDDTLKVRRPSMFHDGFNKSINFYGGWPYATDTPPDPYISSWAEGSGVKAVSHARIGLDSGKGFPFTRKAGT